jgi:hypothetical protein
MNERLVVWMRDVAGFDINCVEPSGLATRETVTTTDQDVSVPILR